MKARIIAEILSDIKPLSCMVQISTASGPVTVCRTEEGDDERLVLAESKGVLVVHNDDETTYIDTDKIESIKIM